MTPETAATFGGQLVVWSARLMAGLWYTRVVMDALASRHSGGVAVTPIVWSRGIRIVWTAGALVCAAHLGLAFAVVHGWSHTSAVQETAGQTAEQLGVAVGWGVYANELFCLYWLGDAAGWWVTGGDPLRGHRRLTSLRNATFAGMMFFATVVFGPWFWQPVSAVALVVWLLFRTGRRARLGRE